MLELRLDPWALLIVFLLAATLTHAQPNYEVDLDASRIEIHLDTSGLFGFLGDKHQIEARITRAQLVYFPQAPEKSSVTIEVRTDQIRVLDPDLKPEDRREVQATMESDRVLDVKQYPLIVFESTTVRSEGPGKVLFTGHLTIRDQTRPVSVRAEIEASGAELTARGVCRFEQTTFGIKPVTAGAGTVRVKDELELNLFIRAVPRNGV